MNRNIATCSNHGNSSLTHQKGLSYWLSKNVITPRTCTMDKLIGCVQLWVTFNGRETMISVFPSFTIQYALVGRRFVPILMEAQAQLCGVWCVCSRVLARPLADGFAPFG